MKKSVLRNCASVAVLAVMSAVAVPAFAQADQPAETQGLDDIVVTASGKDKTQLNSAVSVTSVDSKLIEEFKPSSEAEVFRMIPGIQVAGTSGPGGNSNIAVRGLPVATGGSPFVQIQEDGLPTVLFGDIQFGNNDYWTHFDATVANVEGVRGGSAATYASQAPGAVINYISKTGLKQGGYIQLSKGVNYDDNKVDFVYGDRINDTMYFNIGGYFHSGRGPLHAGYNVSNSVQVKGNVTKEFEDGKGYIRFLFKYADTQEPNYTGSPALANLSGGQVSNIQPFPGFDGRSQSNYSIYNQTFNIVNRDGTLQNVAMDGITTKAKSIQNQFHYEFSDAIHVDNNLRWTDMSGGFASPFFNAATTASVIGSTVNGRTVAAARYASGPNAGQLYTGTYVNNNTNVRTNIRDVGSLANDFNLTGKFDVAGGKLTARAGWFYMNQKIAMDWHTNQAFSEVNGNNPSMLELYDASGNRLTANGIAGYNNNWGSCCARDYALSYTDNAPYLALDLDADKFDVDGSVRFENLHASGWTIAGGPSFTVPTTFNGVTTSIPGMIANGARESLNYNRSYTAWTLGGLYKVSPNTSVFVRASKGGRFNSDRQTVGGKIRADGALCTSTDARNGTGGCGADGVTPSVDFVNQYELGVKTKGELAGGRYSLALTLLSGNFKQSTYELSATRCPGGAGGCVIDAKYKSKGVELYATYVNGAFSLVGNATYTKAKKLASGAASYIRADGMPDLSYTVSANYDAGLVAAGLAATGVSSSTDGNGNVYPGGTTFNGNIKVRPMESLELGLTLYNLFNKLDLRGNGGIANAGVNPVVISGAPVIGRTLTASVRYNF